MPIPIDPSLEPMFDAPGYIAGSTRRTMSMETMDLALPPVTITNPGGPGNPVAIQVKGIQEYQGEPLPAPEPVDKGSLVSTKKAPARRKRK
jgi:hypothetical protein